MMNEDSAPRGVRLRLSRDAAWTVIRALDDYAEDCAESAHAKSIEAKTHTDVQAEADFYKAETDLATELMRRLMEARK